MATATLNRPLQHSQVLTIRGDRCRLRTKAELTKNKIEHEALSDNVWSSIGEGAGLEVGGVTLLDAA
ncbi:hypothetical protein FSC37_22480 [Piscinibacter aquaticus]|uniref:Uncharacterized protein n=1 Tax=Piscinibacter aquaticus TaxID=392597 RepID=A0A5C6TN72_9BURK|nr:hypothetical protein FSC37_22480 [Piscinibacter aquaticus]